MSKVRYVERFCDYCGKLFMARAPHARRCSTNCQNKAWRAYTMLAGTHGWVGQHWRRLALKESEEVHPLV